MFAELAALFASRYRAVYAVDLLDQPLEIVNWKVEATGPEAGLGDGYRLVAAGQAAGPALKGRRRAYFPAAAGYIDCPVYDRYALEPGMTIDGPALVEERESTWPDRRRRLRPGRSALEPGGRSQWSWRCRATVRRSMRSVSRSCGTGLVSITDEIVSSLVRTSFSTIVSESYDLSVVLLDAEARLIAQGKFSVPVFIGTAPRTLRYMLEKFPPESLRPGDVIATNDPWIGTGHIFDINVMRPVFRGDRLVGYTMSITHLPDIGGTGFGTAAREIYHEGLRLPICKLVSAGTVDPFILDLVRANVRVPDQVVGDLMANITCNEVGGRQLLEFMDEYGLDDLTALSAAIRENSERAMRAKIDAMRDGVYLNRIQIEGIDAPIPLACRVEIEGGGGADRFRR